MDGGADVIKNVTCDNSSCGNAGIEIPIVDWTGSMIVCGPCGTVLAEQADWYTPPEDETNGGQEGDQ